MSVYIKNVYGEETVRELPFFEAIKLRFIVFLRYRHEELPIVKFLF